MRKLGSRSLGLVGLLGTALALAAEPAPSPALTRVSVASESLFGQRLRIGGKPGDFVLDNGTVSAVVARADGRLVDFWRHLETGASSPQLAGQRDIDGLWQLVPTLHHGIVHFPLRVGVTRLHPDAIEIAGELTLGPGRLRVATFFRLDADRPRLVITSILTNIGTTKLSQLYFGDSIKWGNVDYVVEGIGRTPHTFSGQGRWIGRQGGGGDLKLATLEEKPMLFAFKPSVTGISAPIETRYRALELRPGDWEVVQRSLAYEALTLTPPSVEPTGTLAVSVDDEFSRPLPSKLTIRGRLGTPDPDFGNDGDQTGAANFMWSGTGRFIRTLKPGQYQILATSGPEREAAWWQVEIRPGQTASVGGRLAHVVPTPGWISADLHLHQAPSVDADIAYDTRVISIAAEGVEFAVATDHYAVTDLAPTVARLEQAGQLSVHVRTMVGTEVSTVGRRFGHFNLFPVDEHAHIHYENTTPNVLFKELRALSPGGILQVNHPRWRGIGYFDYYRVDPETGAVPAAHLGEYSSDFDALEVFNGFDAWDTPRVRAVFRDWLHQLNRGQRYTATGNSDSHKLFFVDPGMPRNMIHYGEATSDAEDLKAPEAAILAAIKGGRVVVTNGPMLEVDIRGHGPGETIESGEAMLPLHIRVRAAPWIDVRDVSIVGGREGGPVQRLSVPPTQNTLRLDQTVLVRADRPTYYVVFVSGQRALPNVHHPGITPLAFSNPIWVVPSPGPSPHSTPQLPKP